MKNKKSKIEILKTLSFGEAATLMTRSDNARRMYAVHQTAIDYIAIGGYYSPSRTYPYSHIKPLLTVKFAKYMAVNDRDLAVRFGVVLAEKEIAREQLESLSGGNIDIKSVKQHRKL